MSEGDKGKQLNNTSQEYNTPSLTSITSVFCTVCRNAMRYTSAKLKGHYIPKIKLCQMFSDRRRHPSSACWTSHETHLDDAEDLIVGQVFPLAVDQEVVELWDGQPKHS